MKAKKNKRPSDATLIRLWSKREQEFSLAAEAARKWKDEFVTSSPDMSAMYSHDAQRYQGIATAYRWCIEDLKGK